MIGSLIDVATTYSAELIASQIDIVLLGHCLIDFDFDHITPFCPVMLHCKTIGCRTGIWVNLAYCGSDGVCVLLSTKPAKVNYGLVPFVRLNRPAWNSPIMVYKASCHKPCKCLLR